jgi:hypothetical protein
MSCNTWLSLFRSKREELPIKIMIDGVYVDLNWKTVDFLIGENGCTDWNEWGVGVVFYQKIEPTIETDTVIVVISEDTELQDSTYKYRVKLSQTWNESYRTPLYNVVVNV